MAANLERVSAEGALRGVLSFGYFSLHKQRKVTRRKAKAFAVAFKLPNEATTSTTTAEAKLSPLRASYFSLLAQRKDNQKKARPAYAPSALRAPGPRPSRGSAEGAWLLRSQVRGSRLTAPARPPGRSSASPFSGEPCPAADGVHPCTPPFGCFPVDGRRFGREPGKSKARATAKAKAKQQLMPSNSQSNGNGNSNSNSNGNGNGNGFDAARLA
ncbi:hypothetical protein [Xanthomonas sontii]|uniref:hypothetical protein n=1 Tax=Xanthomonas sontii TaxID=2650745 RepID=UPI00168A7739|nr:hypothetical protein [Xanthomonas sontii]